MDEAQGVTYGFWNASQSVALKSRMWSRMKSRMKSRFLLEIKIKRSTIII